MSGLRHAAVGIGLAVGVFACLPTALAEEGLSAAVLAAQGGAPVLVDVRSQAEWEQGHLRDAIHLPLSALVPLAPQRLADPDADLVTYCQSGGRALRAAQRLREMGYSRVRAFSEWGYAELVAAGFAPAR